MRFTPALLGLTLFTTACMSLEYDLSTVPVPVSAKSAPPDTPIEPLRIEAKHVLYAHGALGERTPDVAWLIANAAQGYREVRNLRVSHGADFHDWLLTHLTLTLLRFKSVTIDVDRVR